MFHHFLIVYYHKKVALIILNCKTSKRVHISDGHFCWCPLLPGSWNLGRDVSMLLIRLSMQTGSGNRLNVVT